MPCYGIDIGTLFYLACYRNHLLTLSANKELCSTLTTQVYVFSKIQLQALEMSHSIQLLLLLAICVHVFEIQDSKVRKARKGSDISPPFWNLTTWLTSLCSIVVCRNATQILADPIQQPGAPGSTHRALENPTNYNGVLGSSATNPRSFYYL